MTRSSAWRRIRVARWSTRNRSSSSVGSSVRRSILSKMDSCRWSRVWLRRAMLRNTSLRPWRTFASSTAAFTAVRCSSLKARPTWPISSSPYGSGGASWATSTVSPWRSRWTTRGSRSIDISSAAWRRPASRLIRLRPIRTVARIVMITVIRPSRPAIPIRVKITTAAGELRATRALAACASNDCSWSVTSR